MPDNEQELPVPTREQAAIEIINARTQQYTFQKWLVDDVEELSYLQNALRGLVLSRDTNEFIIPKDDDGVEIDMRLMNDKGARVLTEVYLIPIGKVKLSRFEAEEINQLMLTNMEGIIDHLFQNCDAYAVKPENLGLILTIIETYLKGVFNRAYKGMEQERLKETQKVIQEERRIMTDNVGSGVDAPYNNYAGGGQSRKKWFGMF